VATTGLLDIDMREVQALQRELRAVSKDFANAVQNELRAPVTDLANTLKRSAKSNLPSYVASDAASTIRATSSNKSGYSIKRADNSRFTQDAYTDRTGRIRHPLFGNRKYWYDTPKPPGQLSGVSGWWSRVLDDNLPEAVDEFTQALLRILDRLATGNLSTSTIASGKTRTKTVL
jgi:hypothetical protein